MYTTLPDSQCGVALGQRILFGGSLEKNKKVGICFGAMMKRAPQEVFYGLTGEEKNSPWLKEIEK